MSWNDAKAFVAWLSQKTGRSYRLLSEAEREYVTRAGTTTPFWWGSTITPEQANYDGKQAKTVPVKSFQPNPWGLYQVHGNVWEWVDDCWHDSYEGAPTDGSAWTAEGCGMRTLRGGSWGSNSDFLRSAYRGNYLPTLRDANSGFRLARTLD
ncbi:MAG: formylglycine-generating enzyme family protein [Rhodomicrobium sp.]